MPTNAPTAKRSAVEHTYKATVIPCQPSEREKTASEVMAVTECAEFIHPSEDTRVIAGQGTVGVEMVSQIEGMFGPGSCLDCVIIPVGGGGLASGNIMSLKSRWPNCKVVLAEPEAADDARRSWLSKEMLGHPIVDGVKTTVNTVADGLKTELGVNTYPIVRDLADEVITVSEIDILKATKQVWERMKVLIEPSAGVGVAVLQGKEFNEKFKNEEFGKIGIVLCGGNVDVVKTAKTMEDMGI